MGSNRNRRPRRSSSSSSDSGDEYRLRSLLSRGEEKKKKEQEGISSLWLVLVLILTPIPLSNLSFPEVHKDLTDIMDFTTTGNVQEFFKARPMGIRWRDDHSWSNSWQNQQNNTAPPLVVMPVITERPRSGFIGRHQLPTTSSDLSSCSSEDDPSLEDIELIDVLWRSDIAAEKGTRQLTPSDQYESDLQLLTEKSVIAPLTDEESTRYEDLAKVYFEDFYNPIDRSGKLTTVNNNYDEVKRDVVTPTDEDLDALWSDMKLKDSQLNQLTASSFREETPVVEANSSSHLINNVSLSEGIIYNQNNVTELEYLRADQKLHMEVQQEFVAPSSGVYNNTPADASGEWMRRPELSPAEVYPTAYNQTYNHLPSNSTEEPVVSTGVHYDHAYQSTHTTSQAVYDPYYSTRASSFSESSSGCSSSSGSPRYNSEAENRMPTSRYFGKLAPEEDVYDMKSKSEANALTSSNSLPRRRGRQSKDEHLAMSNNLPVTAKEIAEMTLAELQKMLKNDKLTEQQRALIKKIRRRGKNKVAARQCRQRRGDRHMGPGSQQQWDENITLFPADE